MKKTINYLLLFAIACVLWCCNRGVHADMLTGKWKAVELYEKDQPVQMDLAPVHFEFFKNGDYTFNSTLNYREAGHFYVLNPLLYTTDTTAVNPIEKAVKILSAKKDSITFLMNDNGIEKVLKLVRADASPQ